MAMPMMMGTPLATASARRVDTPPCQLLKLACENGDPVPAWVKATPKCRMFMQRRESPQGYKAIYALSPGGVRGYIVEHIMARNSARIHGDHDFELCLKTPSGKTFYYAGILCFADPCKAPIIRRDRQTQGDTDKRPILLASSGPGFAPGYETWYGSSVFVDVEFTVGNVPENAFTGVSYGDDTSREGFYILFPKRISDEAMKAELSKYTRVEAGVARISFTFKRHFTCPPQGCDVN